jgi:REP element-mobilizing transposase RayT
MPDHVHLLVEGLSDASNALTFIDRAKQYSGYYFKQAFCTRLWQRYGFEHTLRNDEVALSVARYILDNPIRAGLVQRVQDYPFCGSLMHPIEHILDAVAMKSD